MAVKIQPKTYFYTGLAIMPPFLFTENIYLRAVFLLFILFLNLLTGRKFRIMPNIIITAGVVLANIYPPGGKIYFSIGNLLVTEEALITGLKKALFLTGSVYISRFAVRKELIFPGKTGNMIYKTFYYFEKFTEMKLNFKKHVIEQIDMRLMEIENSSHAAGTSGSLKHSFYRGSDWPNNLLFFSVAILFWAFFAVSEIYLGRG